MQPTPIDRRTFLVAAAGGACACAAPTALQAQDGPGPYKCPPCGCAMDGEEFAAPGQCPACGMTLVPRDPLFEPIALPPGPGLFLAAGGAGREGARIGVHYYRPENYTRSSPILLIVPGDGRNGGDYRDAWMEDADAAGVLVAALAYAEQDYDFAAYQMGGVIKDLEVRNLPVGPDGELPSRVFLRDEDISFALNPHAETWLFNDFDRVFGLIAAAVGSTRPSYDLFGHSAGGQILHRSVLFRPRLRADRIIASNAGQYSFPDLGAAPLIGMAGIGIGEDGLRESLGRPLTLLLGENDDDTETRGSLLHTPLLDQFGDDRLSRGQAFYEAGRARAEALAAPFNWMLEIVPNVGHDFRAMCRAAALRLYG